MISPGKTELEIEEDRYFYARMENMKTYKLGTTIISFNTKRKDLVTLKETST